MANKQAPAILILGRVCIPSFDVTGFLSMRRQWFELVPKNWTDGLALALISNPRERIRRR